MSKLWSYMTEEDKKKYHELREELINALTKNEVRYYANQMHELLDKAELKMPKIEDKGAEKLS
ncbi:hypothetical protein K7887_22130 (plasmid) [Sutcliffiella horikoshii]|uniref:hypothetical protein n=1 Tax=Sutcliffiella horikoshii TaxID=79883 RepID=UPI001CC0A687|nr:hypothetical protein [Sutcliffiella horikoshii]UAL49820.1 hypothetical protein K7887_22130 [Sutcliffiella horikoshii]